KRKENYDDWWRCELRFAPDLDDEFGVTHTKQGVHPTERMRLLLTPDIERIAHKLNARVREAFITLKATDSATARRANERDVLLEPPRITLRGRAKLVNASNTAYGITYRIATKALPQDRFFCESYNGSEISVTLNSDHPFFHTFYSALNSTGHV